MTTSWVKVILSSHKARFRLICFPHSGSGASYYYSWSTKIPPEIELIAIQLPGREERIYEEPIQCMTHLINNLMPVLTTFDDKPSIFFGHSFGGVVAFELARQLCLQERLSPLHIFVSAKSAPYVKTNTYSHLSDLELLHYLNSLQGTSEAILKEQELMRILLPILRADLAVNDSYSCTVAYKIPIPITVFGGKDDSSTPLDSLLAWKDLTTNQFHSYLFPGGHFYLNEHASAVIDIIKHTISTWKD